MKAKKSDNIDETNYRNTAHRMVAKYEEKGMIVDALLWAHIVGHYETALKKAGVPPEEP